MLQSIMLKGARLAKTHCTPLQRYGTWRRSLAATFIKPLGGGSYAYKTPASAKLPLGRMYCQNKPGERTPNDAAGMKTGAQAVKLIDKFFAQIAPSVHESTNPEDEQRAKQEEAEEKKRSKRNMKISLYIFGATMLASVGGLVSYLGKEEVDKDGNVVEDEYSKSNFIVQYVMRTYNNIRYYKLIMENPSREQLLPDPLTPPYYQPPYTLLLDVKDVLVHPEWTYKTGWRFKKRPGVDHLLKEAFKDYEIVIFTTQSARQVYPLIDSLDPSGLVAHRLMRDATRFVDGHHVKDLDVLNRDLSKVIVIDCNEDAVMLHRENALILPPWKGNDDDKELYSLLSLLRIIAETEVVDVRETLRYYSQFPDPLEKFRENQRLLEEQLQQKEKELAEKQKQASMLKRWTSGFPRRP